MNKIELIKNTVTIRNLSERFNARPDKSGKCKFNPLRSEKTSSLHIYDDTNSWFDFGSEKGGSVIDFIVEANGCDIPDAINDLCAMYSINTNEEYTKPIKQINNETIKKEYMSDTAILKAFNSPLHKNITLKDHKEILISIAPEYVILESNEDDKLEFFNLLKVAKPDEKETAVVLLPDYKGIPHTFRYRYKQVGDETKKWTPPYGTFANYAYCRLNENPITLIVEGTRDYLSALLCGYSVIAIPSAGFKKIDNEWLKDRTCIFIDDDDDKNSMIELYENAICEKIFFNHKSFKEITKCKSKDFSDYLYQFDNLETFKNTFENAISLMKNQKVDEVDWLSKVFEISKPITKEDIKNVENQEFLYPELLIKRNITTLVSPANTGKSALVFGMAKNLLDENRIENVLFFDPDSSIGYVKNTVNDLLDKYEDKFHYFNGVKNDKSKMMDILLSMTLMKENKDKHTLIILDGLQFFINGEISKDSNVKPFMETLQQIRDKFGATIILLHHTKRAKDESGNVEYLGTQIIETATDNMIVGTAKNDKIFLYIKKSRSDKKNNVYTVDVDFANKTIKNVTLKGKKDDLENQEVEVNKDFSIDDILSFMEDRKVGLKELKSKFGKEVSEVLRTNTGTYWNKKTNDKDKYSPIYYVIETNQPTITEFDNTVYDDEALTSIFGD